MKQFVKKLICFKKVIGGTNMILWAKFDRNQSKIKPTVIKTRLF